jgi:hypothetical protein
MCRAPCILAANRGVYGAYATILMMLNIVCEGQKKNIIFFCLSESAQLNTSSKLEMTSET